MVLFVTGMSCRSRYDLRRVVLRDLAALYNLQRAEGPEIVARKVLGGNNAAVTSRMNRLVELEFVERVNPGIYRLTEDGKAEHVEYEVVEAVQEMDREYHDHG